MADTLPSYVRFLAEGFKKDRATALSRTSMEDGMVKQLQTKTRVFLTRSFTLEFLTYADYTAFILFFQVNLLYGALWFNFTDVEDGIIKLGRFVSKIDNERPMFGNSKWRIDVQIETWTA